MLWLHAHQSVILRIGHWLDVGMWYGIKLVEFKLVVGTDVDVSSLVFCAVTILRCREDYMALVGFVLWIMVSCKHTRDTLSAMLLLIPFHSYFVTANNSFQSVVVAESLGNIRSKLHADTSLAGSTSWLCLRISPQHLHHQSSLAGLALIVTVKLADIIQSNLIIREQTSVKDEIFLANQSGERQCRETF